MRRVRQSHPEDSPVPRSGQPNIPRVVGLASYLVLLVALVASSEPRLTGDGPEYVAQALRLSAFHLPPVPDAELSALNAVVFDGNRLEQNTLPRIDEYPTLVDSKGQRTWPKLGLRHWPHFWLYSLLVVPFMWATHVLGLGHLWAFTALNILLLGGAFWVVSGRMRWPPLVLLFVGPIIWWVDKAHTEVMTLALLSGALTLAAERPWWSFVALGAAAAHNSFLGAGIPLLGGAAILEGPHLLRDARLWTGLACGSGLTLLKPLYNLWQVGVAEPQMLAGGTCFRIPTVEEVGAPLWDPNIGLLQGFPVLLVVVLLATMWLMLRVPALLRSPWPWTVSAFGLTILVSATQTTNMNSSATPSMSRYALMLIPLAIPLLLTAQLRLERWEAVLIPLTAASVVLELLNYHPRLKVDYLRPTPLADFLWSNYPGLDNPPPEVFFDRTRSMDSGQIHRLPSVGTPTCSKVLLREGLWPSECPSDTVPPPSCRRPDQYCYANRQGGTYRFVEAAPHYPCRSLSVDTRFRSVG